jgi:hypothetical protein
MSHTCNFKFWSYYKKVIKETSEIILINLLNLIYLKYYQFNIISIKKLLMLQYLGGWGRRILSLHPVYNIWDRVSKKKKNSLTSYYTNISSVWVLLHVNVYFHTRVHLNSDTKFLLEILNLYMDFITFTVEKNRFTYLSCSKYILKTAL